MINLNIIQTPSPNCDDRVHLDGSVQSIDMLIMHYTGMKSGKEALERMCDPHAKVSAHYMVEEDGRVFQMVDESQRAWHAGVASWRGHANINARSIGIEIVNPGHEWGYVDFPEAQIETVIALSKAILMRHDIPACNVIGHSDVAPMRKQDPGELFPWQRLAGEGIGVWHKAGAARQKNEQMIKQLQEYGYGIANTSSEKEIMAVMTAFQRHFRPALVNGRWDEECENRLDTLLQQV